MTTSHSLHPALPLADDELSQPMARLLLLVSAAWALPVVLTLLQASANGILVATLLAAAVCAAVQVLRPAAILVTLPFFALLSPVTGLLELGFGRLVLSDVLFGLLAVQAVLTMLAAPREARSPLPLTAALLGLLFATGAALGFAVGYLASLKPMLYLAQLAIVGFFTARHAARDLDWLALQRAWVVASALGAAIMLQAYAEGRSLDTLKDAAAPLVLDPNDLLSLFRATYYYTGFHFILGLSLLWVGIRMFFPATHTERAGLLGLLALLWTALLATVNKTAVAAVAVALGVSAVMLFLRFRREMTAAMLWLIVFAVAAAAVLSWQYAALAETTQVELIVGSLFSLSSLFIRFEVYLQAVSQWSASPWTVLIGYGPDFLDSSGRHEFAEALKTSAVTGYVEGTLDSGWLSYLVELGLPAAFLLVLLFSNGLATSLRSLRRTPRFDRGAYAQACVFGGLVFLAIAMTTQMLGYSKTSWLPLQLVLVAAMGPRRVSPGSR